MGGPPETPRLLPLSWSLSKYGEDSPSLQPYWIGQQTAGVQETFVFMRNAALWEGWEDHFPGGDPWCCVYMAHLPSSKVLLMGETYRAMEPKCWEVM